MKRSTIVAAAGAVTLLAASPAAAINTYNAQPAPERTEVGAYLALWDTTGDGVPDRFDWRCSGTMVDDDTFLTAAHCTDGSPAGTRTFVSLEEDVQSLLDEHADLTPSAQADLFLANGWVVEGDPHQDARYPGPASDTADIAVVDFAGRDVTPADVWDFTPATLPTAGQLDRVGGTTLARAVDGRRLRHRRGAERARRSHAPRWRRPAQGQRGLQRPDEELGAPVDQRVEGVRRRLLRRQRRPELRHRRRAAGPRRDDDHR